MLPQGQALSLPLRLLHSTNIFFSISDFVVVIGTLRTGPFYSGANDGMDGEGVIPFFNGISSGNRWLAFVSVFELLLSVGVSACS